MEELITTEEAYIRDMERVVEVRRCAEDDSSFQIVSSARTWYHSLWFLPSHTRAHTHTHL